MMVHERPVETASMTSQPEDARPSSPVLDRRPPLSPRTEIGLRLACAEMLRSHDPSVTELYEEIRADARRLSRKNKRPSENGPPTTSNTATFKYIPTNAASSFNVTATSRTTSLRGQRASSEQLERGLEIERPSTTAPAYDSTATTTRITTWGTSDMPRSKSTGVTTLPSSSHTPAEYVDPEAQAKADARARAWMAEELARRRAEQERPPSRGSRIVEYIRPRSSNGSLRSVCSNDSSAAVSWWRGGSLRRKGSKSSQVGYTEEPPAAVHELDLNRALPPLPSLSTWSSTSSKPLPKPRHGGRPIQPPVALNPLIGHPPSAAHSLPDMHRMGLPQQESQPVTRARVAGDDKMRIGSIEFPLPDAVQKAAVDKNDTPVSMPKPNPAFTNLQAADPQARELSNEKKMGRLRRHFSKFNLGGLMTHRQNKPEKSHCGQLLEESSMPAGVRVS
ncbi:MAG: hypothetical protein M1817_000938 [Caeruleum heppii]|nr:MAG: hypothetical protein M1817_000938 [Caeruleum heppii]